MYKKIGYTLGLAGLVFALSANPVSAGYNGAIELASKNLRGADYSSIAFQNDNRKQSSANALNMKITAYTSGPESTGKFPGNKHYGFTASGKKAVVGRTVSVPPEIELGSIVYISLFDKRNEEFNNLPESVKELFLDSYGIFIAEDRGSGVKDNMIDVYTGDPYKSNALKTAKEFGVKRSDVYVLHPDDIVYDPYIDDIFSYFR